MAVISVIHDINLAMEFSTQLLFLHHGKMLAYGAPREIATPEILRRLYGIDFTCYSDETATYVRPVLQSQ